ncbi:MAG: sterol desaturase family protein [Myxococcota bacterium]
MFEERLLAVIASPLIFAGLAALVFMPLEALFPLRMQRPRSLRTDVLFATAGAILTRGLLFLLALLLVVLTYELDAGPLAGLPSVVQVVLGLAYFELAGYGYHRLAHRSAFLFRFHRVHHTSTTMDWLAGFRQHPVEILLMTAVQNVPLVLQGLPLGQHILVVLAHRLNTLVVHANLRTPRWLGWFIATPSFHHRHHATQGPVANFATLFPFIDRLFHTHRADEAKAVGLGDTGDEGFMELLVAPVRPEKSPVRG